jgi:AraC-like DNA-binding protein
MESSREVKTKEFDQPDVFPVSADRFVTIFKQFFAAGNLRKVIRGLEGGYPEGEFLSAGVTRVPYMIICSKGTMEIGILRNGTVAKYILQENEAVFLKSNSWIFCDHSLSPAYFRITIYPEYVIFGTEEKQEYHPLTINTPQHLELYYCPHPAEPHTQSLIQRLEYPGEYPEESPWVTHAMNLVLDELHLLLYKKGTPSRGKAYTTWNAIRSYLQDYSHKSLNRKTVASVFSLSPNHVSRLFAQFTDTGFNGMLEKIRMENAVLLLESSHLTVAEIAGRCGYSSANYFIRAFRLTYKMTPGEFRASSVPTK